VSTRPSRSGFFVLGGSLKLDAASYVMRDADLDLYAALKRGEYCYVLTSRQMGKSSLMVRAWVRLRQEGMQAVVIDLASLGRNVTLDQWYMGLLGRVGMELNIEDQLEDYWDRHSGNGPLQRWMGALRDVVLIHTGAPVVIFIDEIDFTRSLPFSADEFFAGIRALYNERAETPRLDRLTFCLLGVATPSDLIQDVRTTPFNIGHRIDLTDFSEEESHVLLQGLRHTGSAAPALLKRIMYWTQGHPYLTQRLCQAVGEDAKARNAAGVDRVCRDVFLSNKARDRDENLMFVRDRMLRSEISAVEMLSVYSNILAGHQIKDDPAHPVLTQLRLAGVIKPQNGFLRIRNRIYEHVFNKAFIESNQPLDEVQRQRAAEWRGRIRVLRWAIPIVGVFAGLALVAWVEAQRAREMAANLKTNAEFGLNTSSTIANRLYAGASKNPALADDYVTIVEATSQFAKAMLGVDPRSVSALNVQAYAGYVAAHQAVQHGDKAQAVKLAQESIAAAARIENDPDLRLRAIAARSHAAAAETYSRLSDSANGESEALKSKSILAALTQQVKPDDQFTLQLVSETYDLLDSAEEGMDHWDHAVDALQRNVGAQQRVSNIQLKSGDSRVFDQAHRALEERNRIARIEFESNQPDAARQVLEEHSLQVAKTLVAWNESPEQHRTAAQRSAALLDLWGVQEMLGFVLASEKGSLGDALQYYSNALATSEKLVQDDPSPANLEKREDAVAAVARTQKLLNLTSDAMHSYVRYVALVRDRATKESGSAAALKLGDAYRQFSDFESHRGERPAAAADYENALEWLSKAANNRAALLEHATVALRLADLSSANGNSDAKERYREAIHSSERALSILRSEERAHNDYESQDALLNAYQTLAFARLGAGDRNGASEALQQSLAAARAAVASAKSAMDEKKTWQFVSRLSSAYGALGWAELLNGHLHESIDATRAALQLDDKPAWLYANLAHAELLSNQIDQARTLYLAHRGEEMYDELFENAVLDDFNQLRKLGYDRPSMAEAEKLLGH